MLEYVMVVGVMSITILVLVLYSIKPFIIEIIEDNYFSNQDYDKIHPEYRDALESVLKEKEEKEFLLNSIKLLNKELESVKRLDEEIKGLLKE